MFLSNHKYRCNTKARSYRNFVTVELACEKFIFIFKDIYDYIRKGKTCKHAVGIKLVLSVKLNCLANYTSKALEE